MPDDFPAALHAAPADALPPFSFWLKAIDAWREGGRAGVGAMEVPGTTEKTYEVTKRVLAQFNAWIGTAKDGSEATGLPTYGTPYQKMAWDMMVFTRNIATSMQQPWNAAFAEWAMHSGELEKVLERLLSPDELAKNSLDYDLMRAEMLEAFGTELEKHGVSKMFNSDLNHCYVTKGLDGKLHRVSQEDVLAMAARGVHVIQTANHAFFENEEDLTVIMNSVEQMTRDVLENDPGLDIVPVASNSQKGQTVIVAATATRENNFLNLADLFRRQHEIHMAREARMTAKDPATETDKFQSVWPIATLLASSFLKAAVMEPGRIISYDGTPHNRGETPQMVTGDAPFTLKDDDTLREMADELFSQGGNAGSDVPRLLVHMLGSTNAKGEELFPGGRALKAVLMEKMAISTVSHNDKELEEYYLLRGAHGGTLFSNREDTTIAPQPQYLHQKSRRTVNINAFPGSEAFGHRPDLMYEALSKNPHTREHLAAELAFCANKPAITSVAFRAVGEDKETGRTGFSLVLETPPGTTDALMEKAREQILETFSKKFPDVQLIANDTGGRHRFELQSEKFTVALSVAGMDYDSSVVAKRENAKMDIDLGEVFAALKQNDALVISSNQIAQNDLPSLARAVIHSRHLGGAIADIGQNRRIHEECIAFDAATPKHPRTTRLRDAQVHGPLVAANDREIETGAAAIG